MSMENMTREEFQAMVWSHAIAGAEGYHGPLHTGVHYRMTDPQPWTWQMRTYTRMDGTSYAERVRIGSLTGHRVSADGIPLPSWLQ